MESGNSGITYRPLSVSDYSAMQKLWSGEGNYITSPQDSEENIALFLNRNNAYCFAAVSGDSVVGFIMVGCDGRSSRVYHLVVASEWRRKGVTHGLSEKAWDVLKKEGVLGLDVIVYREDPSGEFWESEGFRDRDDIAFRTFDDF